jgi:hypothetical protein
LLQSTNRTTYCSTYCPIHFKSECISQVGLTPTLCSHWSMHTLSPSMVLKPGPEVVQENPKRARGEAKPKVCTRSRRSLHHLRIASRRNPARGYSSPSSLTSWPSSCTNDLSHEQDQQSSSPRFPEFLPRFE